MDFKVPMQELQVEVALADAEPSEYMIFLAPFSDRHVGSESIDEYLNGGRSFFPMVAEGVGRIVNRDQILWLKVRLAPPSDDEDNPRVVRKLTILELANGSRLEGDVYIDRPLEQQRVSDVLNDANYVFLRMDQDEMTYFVNKKFVRVAIPR